MQSTKVTLTFSFEIPYSEVAEVDEKDLKKWLNQQLGVSSETYEGGQFHWYGLEEFNPKISNLKIS